MSHKSIFSLGFLVFFILSTAFKTKDWKPESVTSVLTSAPWTSIDCMHVDNQTGARVSILPDCEKDNVWTFTPDGMVRFDPGVISCNDQDNSPTILNWTLSDDEQTLTITFDQNPEPMIFNVIIDSGDRIFLNVHSSDNQHVVENGMFILSR